MLLSDDMGIQLHFDFAGRGNFVKERLEAAGFAFFLLDDVVAEIHTVGADERIIRPFDHGADFSMGLAAEAACAGSFARLFVEIVAAAAAATIARTISSGSAAATAAFVSVGQERVPLLWLSMVAAIPADP